jgi:leucyl/phenylalanyl-tRNA---protein transferase
MNNRQYPSLLNPHDVFFPPADWALDDPNGLLAIGGDLSSDRIIAAYSQGIFPWFSDGEPIMWWTPDPRSVIFTTNYSPSKSLKKLIKKNIFSIRFDSSFEKVIRQCALSPRQHQDGTWITEEMIEAYCYLHKLGIAHSCECWKGDQLVGGLYGLAIGQIFFGESMFSQLSNSSKVAFTYLIEALNGWGFQLVDCQVESAHMNSLGAVNIKREKFLELLKNYSGDVSPDAWAATSSELKKIAD